MDVAAFVVSICAILISIFVPIFQALHDNKINKLSLESLYHQEIYKDYLLEKIPMARRYLIFTSDGKLDETNLLCKTLEEMVFDSLYFFYQDQSFYDDLKEKCDELIEYLVQLSQQNNSSENQRIAMDEVQTYIKEIYSLIEQKLVKG